MVHNIQTYSLATIDFMNRMVLQRVRESTQRVIHSGLLRKWAPLVMILVTGAYLFLGGAAFYFLENSHRESTVRKWYMNLGVNRRHFAKSISSRIFNDTRNLLIIIDREQTERVQQLLVDSLKRYEERLEVSSGDKKQWNLLNSFNYAYGTLLTLGHGTKVPETFWGRLFSTIYTLFGVPLFMATIAMTVHQLLVPLMAIHNSSFNRRLVVLHLSIGLYVVWTLILSLFLYFQVFDEDYWQALQTAVLSAFTVQIAHYTSLSSCTLLILLVLCTISLVLAFLVGFLFMACYGACGFPLPTETHDDVGPIPPKFTVVVDEAGESKLAHGTH